MSKLRVLVNKGDGSVLVWTEAIAQNEDFKEGWLEKGVITMTDGGPVPCAEPPKPVQEVEVPHVVATGFATIEIPPAPEAAPKPPSTTYSGESTTPSVSVSVSAPVVETSAPPSAPPPSLTEPPITLQMLAPMQRPQLRNLARDRYGKVFDIKQTAQMMRDEIWRLWTAQNAPKPGA